LLKAQGVQIYSTGGTFDYIRNLDPTVKTVESLTSYPSILGGRVKTLHPKVFGGILGRTQLESDQREMAQYEIPAFDLVIVDLYPFEETVASTTDESAIIEKIDIGGISLIRAGAKNFNDVLIVPSRKHYDELIQLLKTQHGETSLEDRRRFACYAFAESSHYDTAIHRWFAPDNELRYGENPHQKGYFRGDLDAALHRAVTDLLLQRRARLSGLLGAAAEGAHEHRAQAPGLARRGEFHAGRGADPACHVAERSVVAHLDHVLGDIDAGLSDHAESFLRLLDLR
jgi:AICAR transformylase/IMP cyclohydrolase PurH